ncbi:MAG TPA: isochorismatase family cysteine hydrolase [Longimicrobiales bacterium]|nr:isochorismatase family cysteine hydrolase [Longimicrobiales bacterium]
MPAELSFERGRTAVLIMDYQQAMVSGVGGGADALLERARRVLDAARAAGVPVIYIVVGFREGYPEVSERNVLFARVKGSSRLLLGTPGAEIAPAVAPAPGDVTVVKHRVGAFHGTDLEVILRAREIDTLVLLGIATSGVVLSTVRHAADADYRLVVLADCCADADAEVHRCLLEKVFPRQATVSSSEAFVEALAGG